MSVRSVIFDVIARDKATPAFRSAGASAAAAATSMDRSLARVQRGSAAMVAAGTRLSKAITLPVVAFAAVGIKQSVEFEKQMALLKTAAGVSKTNLDQISSGITKVSNDTATSLHELYEGMYVVAKAAKSRGWTGAEQLTILKAAAQGAKSENVELGVATDALTTIMVDYHKEAGQAVSVENALVKASGLAKTNFGLFSESLSNVTPIAAAAGLSFEEVGGAVATMTQHGVTAQRATDNLRNLIFNLTGQNNVASQAMQQLGIDTVDLAKNLGKRGLTGTLAIVDNALKTHTKNGMVVVDVQKAASLATRSLNTMLGEMPPAMQKQSKALLTGKTGFRDYQLYARSLGGQAGAAALQFLGLAKNSLGFSNQLKAGKGTVTTSITQYQKMLGGMTGAAVAMQIAGKYAKDNAKNVSAVAEAAGHAGKNVHGFEVTQKTLAYKLDDAKVRSLNLAKAVGDKLLPVISKIAQGATGAFKWFDNLSSGTKKFLGYTLLIGAALGPALAITGKLTRGFVILFGLGTKAVAFAKGLFLVNAGLATMQSRAYLAGVGMTTTFNRMSTQSLTAARGVGAALGGAGIGASIGMLTRESSGATKAVGALGSTALGAAAGFAVGGPWGALIGGGAGLLSNLASNFLGAGDSAREAIKPTDEYTSALMRSKGAIDGTIRSLVASDLQKKGAFDAGLKLGIDQKTLTDAASGDKAAIARVKSIQSAYSVAALKGGKNAEEWTRANRKLTSVLGDAAKTLDVNKRAADNLTKANSVAGKNDTARKTALKAVVKLQDDAAASMKKFNQQVGVHGTSLNPTKTNGKPDANGASNTAFLTKQVQSYNKIAAAQLRSGSSLDAVNKGLNSSAAALRAQAVEAGFSGKAIDELIAKYKQTPRQIVTDLVANIGGATASASQLQTVIDNIKQNKVPGLNANSAQGKAVIAAIQARIDALSQKRPVPLKADPGQLQRNAASAQALINRIRQNKVPGLRANTAAAARSIAYLQTIIDSARQRSPIPVRAQADTSSATNARSTLANLLVGNPIVIPVRAGKPSGMPGKPVTGGARGGSAPDGWFSVGERGPELVHKSGDAVHVLSNRQSRRLIHRTGMNVPGFRPGAPIPGFAKGTGGFMDKSAAAGAKSAKAKAASKSKASSKAKASDKQSSLSSRVSTSISNIGQAYSAPFSVSDIGAGRLASTIAGAVTKLQTAIRQGLSKKTAASFRGQIKSLVGTANSQLAALRVKVKGSDIDALRQGLVSSVDDTKTALSTLYGDLKNSGVSKAVQSAIKTAGGGLATMRAAVDTASELLSNMKDFSASISDTLTGAFDATKSGSITDLLAGFSEATGQNNTYTSQLTSLLNRSKGDSALTGFINQLATSGKTATLATLAGSSAGDLSQVSKAVQGYNTSVSAGANAATVGKFGLGVGQQQTNIDNLNKNMTATVNTMAQILAMIPQIRLNLDGKPIDAKISAAQKKQLESLTAQLRKGQR